MKLIPITINNRSGNKIDDLPESFIFNGMEIPIRRVTDRWYQGENNPEYPVSDYFKAEALTGTFILKHEIEDDRWYLCI